MLTISVLLLFYILIGRCNNVPIFSEEELIGRANRASGNCQKTTNISEASILSYANYQYAKPGVTEPISEQAHYLRALTGGYCGSTYCATASCCNSATNPCCALQAGTGSCCPDACYDIMNAVCCGTYACLPGYYCCGSSCCLASVSPTKSPTRNPTVRSPTFSPSTRMPTYRPSTISPSSRVPSYAPSSRVPSYAPNSFRPPTPSSGAPTMAYTLNTWFSCPYFSTSATASATYNVVYCSLSLCPDLTVTVSLCSSDGATCTGDTYLRIFNSTGSQISRNDDYCNSCSYTVFLTASQSSCQVYQIAQGCYNTAACSGQTMVFIQYTETLLPSLSPTLRPSEQPSTAMPTTIAPTPAPTTLLPSLTPTTISPSMQPTTSSPTTLAPSCLPTLQPSFVPTYEPTTSPPTFHPTSSQPTSQPTSSPSEFLFPAQYPPPLNGGEISAAVLGSLVGLALMTLLLYKKQYEDAVHIIMSIGDIVTDMMFVKQIKLRINYLQQMIDLYHTSHDISLFVKEVAISESIFIACLLVILAFSVSNFIAAFVFGNPHFYFASIMQYGIKQLNNDLEAYFVNPYKHHVSHIYSSEDAHDNHVFLALPTFFTFQGWKWWFSSDPNTKAFRSAFLLILFPAHLFLILLIAMVVFFLFILKLAYSFIIMTCLSALVCAGNAAIFLTCMCTSEMNFHFYGRPNGSRLYHFWMTSIGVFFEDLPQLLIQASYAAVLWNVFSIKPSSLQIGSFAFTAWKIQFGLTYKIFGLYEKRPENSPAIEIPQLHEFINNQQEFRVLPAS